MTSATPARTPAAVRAVDWLSSLDDVLGPDDGASPPDRSDLPDSYETSSSVMRWSADPARQQVSSEHPIDAWLHRTYPALRYPALRSEPLPARSITVDPVAMERLRERAGAPTACGALFGVPVILNEHLPSDTMLIGEDIRRGLMQVAAAAGRMMAAVEEAVRSATPGLNRLARQLRAAVPPPSPPPSRVDLARRRRVASAMRRRDRRAARRA